MAAKQRLQLRTGFLLLLLSPALLLTAAAAPLKIPNTELEPAEFGKLDQWAGDDHAAAFATFRKSCDALLRRKGKIAPFAEDLRGACKAAKDIKLPADKAAARKFFEDNFRPVRISRLGERDGFLTGYYEPIVEGSRTRHGEYVYPIYRTPPDLRARVKQSIRALRHRIGRRVAGYFDRGAIEAGALEGKDLEICWLKDPIEAFFIHIQGSARVRLEDGKMLRLNFDAHNGYPYVSVGKILIDRGIIPREMMSMDAIRTFFAEDHEQAVEIMNQNRSYVFFREISELPGNMEPPGAQGVNLTAMRSIAVDKNLHIYGTPFWIEASLPLERDNSGTKFRRLMIAQDTGGAIVGPARADLYFGAGREAGTVAGRIKNPGLFYMLVPKSADPSKRIDPVPLPEPRPVIAKTSTPKDKDAKPKDAKKDTKKDTNSTHEKPATEKPKSGKADKS
jgi:membrane-bound lytic murein transglycosylase A